MHHLHWHPNSLRCTRDLPELVKECLNLQGVELVYLDQVGIPRITRNSQVVIALFLYLCQIVVGGYADMHGRTLRVGRPKTWRYLDARTKRPAMFDKFSVS